MANYETRRARPRLAEPFRGLYVDFPYDLDVDPDTTTPELAVQRSLNGSTEAQPTLAYDTLRLQLEALPVADKDKLEAVFDMVLTQGEPVEFYSDSSKLFHLAAMEEKCVRTRRFPSSASTWTRVPHGGQYRLGALGVFKASTNYVLNGDFLDGTTDWTASNTDISISAEQYLPPSGKASYALKVQAANTTGTGDVYTDCEMATEVDLLGEVCISFLMRCDRTPSTAVTNNVVLKVKAADGTGSVVTVASITPTTKWTRYYYYQLMDNTTIGAIATADATLRLVFSFTNDLRSGPVFISEVQVEDRAYCTGFIPRAATGSTRTATGIRSSDESIRFLNPLSYIHRHSMYSAGSRYAFTVSAWLESFWIEGASGTPSGNMYLWSMGQASGTANEMASVFLTNNGVVTGRVLIDDTAGFQTLTDDQTIALGTKMHIALSWQDWDGSAANSGSIKLYVNGVLESSATHSKYAGGAGDYLFIGTDPDGTYEGNMAIHDLTIDGVFIDGTTYTINDFYNSTSPPSRERTGWRCVMAPGQKGRPARLKNNLYQLDLQLIESRMG